MEEGGQGAELQHALLVTGKITITGSENGLTVSVLVINGRVY